MENPYVLLGIRKTKDKRGGLFLIHNFIYLYEKKWNKRKRNDFLE